MINVTSRSTKIIILELDEKSASVLCSICQNALPDEPIDSVNVKHTIFHAITPLLGNIPTPPPKTDTEFFK